MLGYLETPEVRRLEESGIPETLWRSSLVEEGWGWGQGGKGREERNRIHSLNTYCVLDIVIRPLQTGKVMVLMANFIYRYNSECFTHINPTLQRRKLKP